MQSLIVLVLVAIVVFFLATFLVAKLFVPLLVIAAIAGVIWWATRERGSTP